MHPHFESEHPNEWLNGQWMRTYTGKKFYPFDPRVEDVDIVDIAHHLAMIPRYGGACKFHYSVAQHSVLAAGKAAPQNAMRALLHDSPEYVLGDWIRPIKKHREVQPLSDWLTAPVERAICARFDLPYPLVNIEVKRLDDRILLDEHDQVLVYPADGDVPEGGEPLGVKIEPWAPEFARQKFLDEFDRYSRWERVVTGRAA